MASEDKSQVSLRVPASVLGDIERIARALDRDRTWVMLHAFRAYLDGVGGQILDEVKGLEELDAGKGVDLDVVLDEAEAIIAAVRSGHRAKAG